VLRTGAEPERVDEGLSVEPANGGVGAFEGLVVTGLFRGGGQTVAHQGEQRRHPEQAEQGFLQRPAQIVAAVNNWNSTYAGKPDARCPNPTVATNTCTKNPTLAVPTNFFFGRNFFSQDIRLTKTFKLHSENYKMAIFGEVFNLFNYANMGGQSYTLDSATSGSVGFGIPTTLAGQQFGSGGARAFQVGGRFSF